MVELDYAAVVSIAPDVSEEMRERLVMIEVPRHLFPFARAILADDTREGGFPPLMMSPIDFAQLYLSRHAAANASAAEGKACGQAPSPAPAGSIAFAALPRSRPLHRDD